MGKRNYWLPTVPNNVHIYCLINPINGSVFYVGATSCELNERLKSHLSRSSGAKAKKDVLYSILALGLNPEILLLETVKFNRATFFEQFYMDLFRSFGFELTGLRKSNYSSCHGRRINNQIKTIKAVNKKRKANVN